MNGCFAWKIKYKYLLILKPKGLLVTHQLIFIKRKRKVKMDFNKEDPKNNQP